MHFSREPTSNSRLDIQQVAQFGDHYCTVWRVTWNITGTMLASTGDDGCVRMWKSMFYTFIIGFLSTAIRSYLFNCSELFEELEMRCCAQGRKSTIGSGKFYCPIAQLVQLGQCYCKVLQTGNYQPSYPGTETLNRLNIV